MDRQTIVVSSGQREELIDVTDRLKVIAAENPGAALMSLYARGATSAVMIQENWDPNIREDICECLRAMVPKGRWLHDRVDGNADAHIKAGIIGPSATIPLENGKILLSTWQNVFFCDFDGPRQDRELVVTLLP